MCGRAKATQRLACVLAICCFSAASPARAIDNSAGSICEREMARASREHDVPLGVLYAVGLTETGRRGSLQPWALNIEGAPVFPPGPAEALARLNGALRSGARLVDVGCMQVNHHFHRRAFKSDAEMFDPARNVDYAARFLKDLRRREPSWTLAVARYHAGPDNNPAQKRYVCAVIANMVATGFGSWTEGSRAFCK
jgi:soluble lytic murein transglycosylase-like protein